MRGALTLPALALAAALAAPAADALELDAAPAWQGWSRPGRVTELELRVAGSGTLAITVVGGQQRITTTVTPEPDRPVLLRLPIAAAPVIEVSAGNSASVSVPLALAESPLLAVVMATPDVAAPPGFQRVALAAGDLPGNAAAYGSIDALLIDAASLAALDAGQWTALLGYVGSCGRTVMLGATDEAARLYATAAGCGGGAFAVATTAAEAQDALAELLRRAVASPPAVAGLAAIAADDIGQWHVVVGALLAATALMVLGAVFFPSVAAQGLIATAAAIGGAWFVQSRPPESQLLVWAEAGPGDRLAQYHALLRSTLARRGSTGLPVPTELANPRPCRELQGATWAWSADDGRYEALAVRGRLFERVSLCFGGSFPVARAAQWRDAGDGRIAVRIQGASNWPAGTLSWQGTLVPMSAVAPGAEFIAEPEAASGPASAAARHALERTLPGAVAILWPLDLGPVQHATSRSEGWLLLTAAATTPGDGA